MMRTLRGFGLTFVLVGAALPLIAVSAEAQQFEYINSFAGCPETGCGPGGDAANPTAALQRAPDGNFYGVSPIDQVSGEASPRGWGTVFRVTPAGVRTVLHHFPGSGPGGCGSDSLTVGADGRLYGVGIRCGSTGVDTIYRVDGASFEILREFPADQSFRPTTIVAGSNGAFYGLGRQGSLSSIYKWDGADITPLWTQSEFPSTFTTFSTLIPAADGNLYFTRTVRQLVLVPPFGFEHSGSVMRLTPDERFEGVHSFADNSEGTVLFGGEDGNLYGIETSFRGTIPSSALFRLTPSGTFTYRGSANGPPPIGAWVDGSVFLGGLEITRLMPDGSVALVHQFSGPDGSGGVSALTRGADGHYYGMTREGGEYGRGVFFRLRMPSVDMKANGTDGPITVSAGQPLQISMAFDAASDFVSPSEVYLAVVTPALQILWATPSGFSLAPAPLYSGPLPSFPSTPLITIPNAAVLPAGDYYWVAIVDADANGVPNGHYVDFVKTTRVSSAVTTVRRR